MPGNYTEIMNKEKMITESHDCKQENISDVIVAFSMQETLPYNMFIDYEDGKLTRYMVAPY